MTELKTPDREPDYIYDFDCLFWFEEMIEQWGSPVTNRHLCKILIRPEDCMLCKDRGEGSYAITYIAAVQRAYKDWLVEKYLLEVKHE